MGLGVGMLVDNSVVVIENIYRLRGRGIPAPRAAVQGARQVAGAIVSSTLTTVCVFLPMVFTTGMVLELLSDMAWTITFSLLASLIVALTVVPCAGSTVLRKQKEIKHPWFDRFLNGYEKLLRFCLKRKAIPLTLAIVLLAVSVWRIATMGVLLIPDMGSNQLSITVTVPADTEKEDAFATADAVMDAITNIDGVETVGAMSGGSDSTSSMLMMTGTEGTTDNTSFTYYVLLTDEGASNSKAIQQQIADDTADLNCEVDISASSMDMSALSGSGVEVDIYGQNLDSLTTASQQVMDLLNSVDGIENVSNGQETGDEEVHIVIDKDKAMRLGLTVAQVYQQIAAKLSTDTTATTLKVGRDTYDVTIVDKTETPNLDDLFQMEFITTTTDDDGNTVNEAHTLGEFASRTNGNAYATIARENGSRKISVTSDTAEGYNTTLISRDLSPQLEALDLPDGCTAEIAGETTQVTEMIQQMAKMMALALLFVYFVMVAQFQSLLSPFHCAVHHSAGLYRRHDRPDDWRRTAFGHFAHGLPCADGRGGQQRHCVCGLRQPAAHWRAGAHRCPGGNRPHPYAPHPDDDPDHRACHGNDDLQQGCRQRDGQRHGHCYCGRPFLCNADDPVYCAGDV